MTENPFTLNPLDTVELIKEAVDVGATVCVGNDGYIVVKDTLGQYLIKCVPNGSCIGLTWRDGVTLNARFEDLYIKAERDVADGFR